MQWGSVQSGQAALTISQRVLPSGRAADMATPPGAYTRTQAVKRILLVTDAWKPQVNGVVQTLERLAEQLEAMGVETAFLTPSEFPTAPLPTYPDIKLALSTQGAVRRRIAAINPDHIHIVTEGPLGMLARWHCLAVERPFTTSYHTRFPEYVRSRAPIPESWTYAWLKRFHNAGAGTLVATPSLRAELTARGFDKIKPWTRGVDTEHFHPRHRGDLNLPRPVFLFVGRVAVEKNIEAFLALDLPGSKAVVGTGPAHSALKSRYPDAHFLGQKRGLDLAQTYASADVFVFPSRTDTFGVVLLEAMASGLPVAAYPVTGPIDVVGPGGALSEDLRAAALQALDLDRDIPRKHALTYSWSACAEMFMQHVRAAYA